MRAKISVNNLRKIIQQASKAVSHNPISIGYSGVVLRVTGNTLSAVGSDGSLYLELSAEITEGEDGEQLLGPKPILSWLSTLEGTTELELKDIRGKDLTITPLNMSSYKFRTINTTLPYVPTGVEEMKDAHISDLASVVNAIKYSAGQDGVLIVSDITSNSITLTTTDYYRMSRIRLEGINFGNRGGCVPISALDMISKHAITRIGMVEKGDSILLEGDGIFIASRLLNKVFPQVDGLLSTIPENQVTFNRDLAVEAVHRLNAVADGLDINIVIDKDSITAQTNNIDLGSGKEVIPCSSLTDSNVSLTLKPTYLLEALASHPSENIALNYGAADQPVYLTSHKDHSIISVVMPTRSLQRGNGPRN